MAEPKIDYQGPMQSTVSAHRTADDRGCVKLRMAGVAEVTFDTADAMAMAIRLAVATKAAEAGREGYSMIVEGLPYFSDIDLAPQEPGAKDNGRAN